MKTKELSDAMKELVRLKGVEVLWDRQYVLNALYDLLPNCDASTKDRLTRFYSTGAASHIEKSISSPERSSLELHIAFQILKDRDFPDCVALEYMSCFINCFDCFSNLENDFPELFLKYMEL